MMVYSVLLLGIALGLYVIDLILSLAVDASAYFWGSAADDCPRDKRNDTKHRGGGQPKVGMSDSAVK